MEQSCFRDHGAVLVVGSVKTGSKINSTEQVHGEERE